MHKNNFHFTDGFVRKLFELTDGRIPSEIFEKAIQQLESEAVHFHFTSTSEANLLRIFHSIYDRTLFFRELSVFPHHAEIVIAIPASSNYLTDIVVRNPEYLYQLFDQEYLARKVIRNEIEKEMTEGVNRFKSLNAKLHYLRQFKKRITLKIGINDILHFDELIDTTKQLSFLASSINAQLFEICLREVKFKYALENTKSKYTICSLGKCGGMELNYSSDVDLIIFYDTNESYPQIKRDYHEILSETVQLFAKSSSDVTSNGYIYRVDFRLRPDGKYSPLCKALDDYIKYYEVRGEDWERQMLIKLDFVGGSRELYHKFAQFVVPYVYRTNLSLSIKDKIKGMKLNIERHYNKGENVKTFRGGIRDIEFAVQALQLLHGSKHMDIRNGNSLITLKYLQEAKLISKDEYETLTSAYIFYRRIEHFLQLMNDTQTHLIPDDDELLQKMTKYIQLNLVQHFKEELEKYRNKVRKIFDRILLSDSSFEEEETKIVFRDASKAEKNLLYLRSGQGILERKEFDSRTISLFNSLELELFSFLEKCSDPDKVLDNFTRLVRNSKITSFLYQEFQNKKFFSSTLKIFHYSQKASDLLSLSKSLEEFFITRKAFLKNFEDSIDELSIEQVVFMLAVQFTLKLINAGKLSAILSAYINHILSKILIEQKIGYNYFVAGLGSFGCYNMSFSSDIDLIVVVQDIKSSDHIQQDFQNFLATALDKLKPFEIDFRLRPEGKKSPLVWDIKNYVDYLNNRARVWELQSLTKIHLVYGDELLFKKFKRGAANRVAQLTEKEIKSEIKKMYTSIQQQIVQSGGTFNIKKEKGGLLSIDFILQYLILRRKNIFAKAQGKDYSKMLNLVAKDEGSDFLIIKDNFLTLKNWEIAIQSLFNTRKGIVPSSQQSRALLAEFLGYKTIQDLDKKLREVIKTNYQLFEKYLEDELNILQKYYAHLTAILVFSVYILTLAPSVIQIDSGELATVQAILGIAHPTGYPLFSIVGYLFIKIPFPFPVILKANLLATLWCSLGIYFFIKSSELILLNLQTKTEIKNKKKKELRQAEEPIAQLDSVLIRLASMFSGLLLAFSKTFWMQSTSVEVYSLQIFLFILIVYTTLRIYYRPSKNLFDWVLVGLTYALGFANHMTTMLVIPFSAILFFHKEKYTKRSISKILITFFFALPALILFYSYLPIRASGNPELNWGNPINFENFVRHISGKQYQVWLFASFEAAGKQLRYFLSNFPDEFAYVGLIAGVIGLLYSLKISKKIFSAILATFIIGVLYSINYDISDIDSYFLLAYIIFSFFIALGFLRLLLITEKKFSDKRAITYSLGLLILFPLITNYSKVDQSNTYSFEDYTKAILKSVEKNSVIFTYQWDYFVSPALYFQHVENYRYDVAVIDKELLRRSWYFNQMKRNYPGVVNTIKPEIAAFLEALRPFETNVNYDAVFLERNYRTLMTSLIEKNINEKNIYIGIELVQGEIERGEFTLPQGYQLVPHLLMFKVVKGNEYIPAPDPNFVIRFPKEKNKYIQFIENIAGTMLTYRAAYEVQHDKRERAKVYLDKVRKEFSQYQIPLNILNAVGY